MMDSLRPGIVHIWRATLTLTPEEIAALRPTLSEEEHARVGRRITKTLGVEVVASRGYLRRVLSHYTEVAPADLTFEYGPHGKPILVHPENDLSFNVSHSGPHVIYAVTREDELGVDIERFRPRISHERIARRFFSKREVEDYLSEPDEHRVAAFCRAWTRKEAFIKAKGVGLALPLHQFDVSLKPNDPPALLGTRPDPAEAARWTLHELPAPDDYLAALALPRPDVTVVEMGTVEIEGDRA